MKVSAAKFNPKHQNEFFDELKLRINRYFKENNKDRFGNTNMKIKTIFMICLLFTPFVLIVNQTITSTLGFYIMWVLMGFGTAGIGLSVMHDANHGSYSRSQTINNLVGYLFNFLGSYHINWKIQHNVLHHTYTNVDGLDEDIEAKVIRLSPDQERKPLFKFQAYYASFFYAIMSIYWVVVKDFEQLKRYNAAGLLKGQNTTYAKGLTYTLLIKTTYFSVLFALPILFTDFAWYQVLLGWVLMHAVVGLTLSYIFQLAHVLEETEFPAPAENNVMGNHWAIHQMRTTANFAHGNRILSWYIGGLNYQIEHHLFPNICHVHYRDLSPIVKQTAEEFGVPYNENKTFFGALGSHFSHLNRLGNYD